MDMPLKINQIICVPKYNPTFNTYGTIQIFCKGNIEICSNAEINANECGLNKLLSESYNKIVAYNKNLLKYGRYTGDEKDYISVYECGGGIIELISAKTIINNGLLCTNATNYDSNINYCGGTISIIAEKFINNGIISSEPNGEIIIKCVEFENNGTITPDRTLIRYGKDMHKQNMNKSRVFSDIYFISHN
eukprot:141762_1